MARSLVADLATAMVQGPVPDATLPKLEYERHRKLLLSALSNLARRGLKTDPDDGLDLIHDFFAETWALLASRYDPSQARFETYMYGSFINYARPRIVRIQRWKSCLVNPSSLISADSAEFRIAPSQDVDIDTMPVRRAMHSLPILEHSVLLAYLDGRTASERDLASRYSMTRYKLRMVLSDALGQSAAALGDVHGMPQPDHSVMIALWKDKRTVKEAARYLRITTSEVQDARNRMFQRLVHAVKGESRMSARRYHVDPSDAPAATLISQALSGGGPEAMWAVQTHADRILAFLEDSQSESFLEGLPDASAERLADVYAALAGPAVVDLRPTEVEGAYIAAAEEESGRVGIAFSQVLMAGLPDRFADMQEFASETLAQVEDEEHLSHLRDDPSVRAAGHASDALVRYGMTPVTILKATRAVSRLVTRFRRERQTRSVAISLEHGSEAKEQLQRSALLRAIVLSTHLDEILAGPLLEWLLQASGYVPGLFGGYDAELEQGTLTLHMADERHDLLARWMPNMDAQDDVGAETLMAEAW